MSDDTAFARLRDANPVPEPARLRDKSQDLGALLAATRQRSMDMSTQQEKVETQRAPTPMWRKAMPALVAAAVVFLVAAAFLVFARNADPDVAGQAEPTSPVARYDGNECAYEGPSEFDNGSTVTFTFVNETENTEVGFAVWYVPDGTTAVEIEEKDIFEVVGDPPPPPYGDYFQQSIPTTKDHEYVVPIVLEPAGQHLINCFDLETDKDHPIMFTVKDN